MMNARSRNASYFAVSLACLLFPCFMFLFLIISSAFGEFTHDVQPGLANNPVVWGKPLAGGPIRALFVAPRFTLGDVAQLAVRLDLQYETVALWDAYSIGYDPVAFASPPDGGNREETLKRLRDALKKRLDVIVLANIDTDILPEELFSAILDKVAAGAGLVIAHPRNSAESPLHLIFETLPPDEAEYPLWHGVGECAFPGSSSFAGIGQMRLHEKGRVVMLQYPGDPPRHHCLIQTPADPLDMDALYEENAYSFAAKAVFAAAGRRNAVIISSLRDTAPLGPQEDEIPPDFYPEFVQAMRDSIVAQPARPFQLTLDKPADQRYTVSAQLRRNASDVLIVWNDPDLMPRGATSHQFEIPVGPGAYTLDVWLRTRSGIAEWHSADLVLSGWPEFHHLKLEKTWLLPNDSLEISLDVRPVMNHTREATLYAQATDGYGRVVSDASTMVSHQGGPTSFRIHFSDLLSPLIKIEVFALEGKTRVYSAWELHSAYREARYLSVRQRPGEESLEIVASASEPREYAPLNYFRQLANLGTTWLHAPAGESAIVLAAQQRLRLLPQIDAAATATIRDGLYREPCLNSPGFRDENKDTLRDTTLRHWAGGSGRYSLGNGNCLSALSPYVCQCRHCAVLFQNMLAFEYENTTALNTAWEQDFQDWDFVELPGAFGPGEDGPPAPWIDFRRHMDMAFAEYHGWARGVAQKTDSSALVGACFGSDVLPEYGYYWPALFESLDFVAAAYSPLMIDKTRSFSSHDSWSGTNLINKNILAPPELYGWLPWFLAFEGIHALWLDNIFGDEYNPAPDAWLLPDGNPTKELAQLSGAVASLVNTVGPLFYIATPDASEIAVYDSHASRHLADVDKIYETSSADVQQAVAAMLRLAEFSFTFVDKTRLLDATPEKYKAIVLPLCRALGTDEIEAIKRYVSRGGAVIADVIPGDCDLHGVVRNGYELRDVFGINTSAAPAVVAGSLTATSGTAAEVKQVGITRVNTAVILDGGVPLAGLGEVPAWITNRFGEGYALVLNHPFRSVSSDKGQRIVPHEFHAITDFISNLPGLENRNTREPFLGTVKHYRLGDARILAFLADPDASRQSIRLPLEKNDAAYNALTGEKISRPHRAKLQAPAGQPIIVSVLPQPVTGIFVDVPDIAHAGQRLTIRIVAQTTAGRAGDHLFIVDLMPFNGAPIPWYRRFVTTKTGAGETYIPLARNEILGRYTLRVRDVLTGLQQNVPVALSSPAN